MKIDDKIYRRFTRHTYDQRTSTFAKRQYIIRDNKVNFPDNPDFCVAQVGTFQPALMP